MKQKLKGKTALNEDEFEKLTDISSISGGSDQSENEDDSSSSSSSSDQDSDSDETKTHENPHYAQVARNKPKILFKLNDNTFISMLRCVLHGKKVKIYIYFYIDA